jgi:hypothetical protein
MDVIRITMNGYGCEINRGIVPEGKEKNIEDSLDNVWFKDLFKRLEEKTEIKKVVQEIGLINGDIEIEVNGELVLEMSVKSFEAITDTDTKVVKYPKTKDFVITSIQHQEGVFSDTIFVLNDDFDINKLKLIKKDIKDKVDNTIIPSLYCELYYEDEKIPMIGNLTDLRMSRLYLENTKKDEQKKNRKF